MPASAGENEVVFVHGDINNDGRCHVRAFGPGEPVQGLGSGTFEMWLLGGPSDVIRAAEERKRREVAPGDPGSVCPWLGPPIP